MGTFVGRVAEFERQFGTGRLESVVTVDQVYAHYQEVRKLSHPRGGTDHALRDALFVHSDAYMTRLARGFITEDGCRITEAAIDVVAEIDRNRESHTPIEFFNLVRSGAHEVLDDGESVYYRPPDVHRLSKQELRAQHDHGHRLDYGAHSRPRLDPL
jgi:hypothetical protein